MTFLYKASQRARRVPVWLRIIIFLPSLILLIYWMITFSGPYRSISIWQAGDTGEYTLAFSILLTFMLMLLPTGALIHLIAGFFPEKTE